MKAMIFAAGLGTRLKPLTDTIPKALLPIGGKTLLEWQLTKIKNAGISDVVINIHHFPKQIVDFCNCNQSFGMNIRFSDESDMLLETGGGLKKAESLLTDENSDEPILVCNVDILSNIDLRALMSAHNPSDLATIVVSERETQRYFLFDDTLRLQGWTNIKTEEIRLSKQRESICELRKLAFSGMHIVSPRIFSLMQPYPDKFSITDFYINTCSKESIKGYIPQDYKMMDIGKIEHLLEAEVFAQTL